MKRQDPDTCPHPKFVKERILGADTGDVKCSECGEVFTKDQQKRIEEARAKATQRG